MIIFAARFKELRQSGGYFQTDLAQEFGVSQNTICKWEKGQSAPTYEKLLQIAEYFDVSTDYLLGYSAQKQNTDIQKTPTSLPADAQNILNLYNSLSPERQREAAVWLKTLNELDSQTATASKKRKEIS